LLTIPPVPHLQSVAVLRSPGATPAVRHRRAVRLPSSGVWSRRRAHAWTA